MLPHLTQQVLLGRGQAQLVHTHLAAELRALLHRDPDAGLRPGAADLRLSEVEALSLAPLGKLLKRLDRLCALDRKPLPPPPPRKDGARKPKPRKAKVHKFSVPYDQLTVLRHFYPHMLASAGAYPGHQAVVATALGQFHQPSLTLERHIKLPPADRLPPRG